MSLFACGFVAAINGSIDIDGLVTGTVQTAQRDTNGYVTLRATAAWSGYVGIGEYVELYGCIKSDGTDMLLDGTYQVNDVNATTFDNFKIIINCTPLGTHPTIEEYPPIPFDFLTPEHLAYDLIYNPEETIFLKQARLKGAVTKNGLEMLQIQAEKGFTKIGPWQYANAKELNNNYYNG